jgi:hypothetical protein
MHLIVGDGLYLEQRHDQEFNSTLSPSDIVLGTYSELDYEYYTFNVREKQIYDFVESTGLIGHIDYNCIDERKIKKEYSIQKMYDMDNKVEITYDYYTTFHGNKSDFSYIQKKTDIKELDDVLFFYLSKYIPVMYEVMESKLPYEIIYMISKQLFDFLTWKHFDLILGHNVNEKDHLDKLKVNYIPIDDTLDKDEMINKFIHSSRNYKSDYTNEKVTILQNGFSQMIL